MNRLDLFNLAKQPAPTPASPPVEGLRHGGSNGVDRDATSGDRKLAWQRALEQAQQSGFQSWFSPTTVQVRPPSARSSNSEPGSPHPWGVPLPAPLGRSGASGMGHGMESSSEGRTEATSVQVVARGGASGDSSEPSDAAVSGSSADSGKEPLGEQRMAPSRLAPQGTSLGTSGLARSLSLQLSTIVTIVDKPSDVLASTDSSNWASTAPLESAPSILVVGDVPQTRVGPTLVVSPPYGTQGSEVPAQESLVGNGEDAPEPVSVRIPPQGGATPALQEPIRLHAEWSEFGVRVWLGADADQPLPLSVITLHLQQWLSSQGERLVSLVCNGRTVWHDTIKTPINRASLPEFPSFQSNLPDLISRRPK